MSVSRSVAAIAGIVAADRALRGDFRGASSVTAIALVAALMDALEEESCPRCHVKPLELAYGM